MEQLPSEFKLNPITASKLMQDVMDAIKLAAPTNVPVLITGESGSGRKTAAHILHEQSQRASQALVAVQCTECLQELIESEIFGSESGRLIGKASGARIGCFELAKGGSILFDGIEDLSPSMQLRLLRVFEERRMRPPGAIAEIPIDVRIVATLERSSASICDPGKLRRELFTFLQAFRIHIPPLRHRKDDLSGLTQSILREANSRNGKHVVDVSAEVRDLFLSHVWPGNIRELQSVLEHAVVVCENDLIHRKHLPDTFGKLPLPVMTEEPSIRFPIGATLESMECTLILQTLRDTGGNKTTAAELLGISLKTLHNKLHVYAARQQNGQPENQVNFPLGMTVGTMERELIMQTLSRMQNNKTRTADVLGISLKTLHNKLTLYRTNKK